MSLVFDIPQDVLSTESSMDNIDKWDSLAHLNLLVTIEEEFEIALDAEEYLQMTSYIKIKQILESKGLDI